MTDWIITNCESVGNMHEICQDHTEFMVSNKVYVGALADGVSSNRFSDEGATIVTQIACQEMCDNFKEYYSGKRSAADFVHKIQDEVRHQYLNPSDIEQMKSTLLVCAIKNNQFILGHIGDGAILCFGKNSYIISPPQENSIGGTATYTILDYNADEHFELKTGTVDGIDGFLLTSDGLLGNVYYSGLDIPQLAFELFGSVYKDSSPKDKAQRDAVFKDYLRQHIQEGDDYADDCSLYMIARTHKTGYINYDVQNGFEADVKWPCKCGNMNRMDEVRCSNCRTTYLSLYSPSIISIHSKEAFFSRLNKWIMNESKISFEAGSTAEILNNNSFVLLTNEIRTAVKITSQNDHAENNDLADEFIEAPGFEHSEETDTIKTLNETPVIKEELPNFWTTAVKFLKRVKKGLQSLRDSHNQERKGQKSQASSNERAEIEMLFPIALSLQQLVEASYQNGMLPVTFASGIGNSNLNEKHLIIADSMFRHNSFLDILQYEGSASEICHYYRTKEYLVGVYDDGNNDFACQLWSLSSIKRKNLPILDEGLNPGNCFSDEIEHCESLNRRPYKFDNHVIIWKWYDSYRHTKADAAKMTSHYYDMLRYNDIPFEEPLANLWCICGNNSNVEMAGYLLTNHYLILVKSLNNTTVRIQQVSITDNTMIQLRNKYL